MLRLVGEASTLRNQVVQIDEYLASLDRDRERTRKEIDAAQADMERLGKVKEDLSERLSAQQMQLESLSDKRERMEAELTGRKAGIAEARTRLEEIRSTVSRQRARKESLEEILSHRAYTTESVKHLFTTLEREPVEGFKPTGVLADFVEVTNPEWEKASEQFLHDELEYVVVNDWNEAQRGIELMQVDAGGRATFLRHHAETPAIYPSTQLLEDPAVKGRLSDAIRLTNGFSGSSAGMLPRLANCLMVEDATEAQRLASSHPGYFFLLPDGTTYQGSTVTGGRKASGGPLALKRELRELTGQVEAREREADELAGQMEQLEQTAAQISEELEYVRTQQQKQERDALALDHEQRKLAEELARSGQRISVAKLELERLEREEQRSRAKREESQQAVAEREQQKFDQEKALEDARAEVERLQAQAHTFVEEHAALRAELAGLDERLRSERSAAARMESQIRQVVMRRTELAAALESMGVERSRLLNDNIELDQRSAALAEQTSSTTNRVQELVVLETEGRKKLAESEGSLKSIRAEAQQTQEQRNGLELELVKKQGDLKYLDETSRKELDAGAAEIAEQFLRDLEEKAQRLAAQAEGGTAQAQQANAQDEDEDGEPVAESLEDAELDPEVLLSEEAVAEAEERYTEIRRRIEALGPVNPNALEEFMESEQRYEFLNTQRQDLLDSIRDTEKAIHELDTESRRRFQEAFEAINENFKGVFRTLFGGGQGEMRLTDDTNLAESGIDIMASPPGKKLQNIALLSGGEKSLTAMALLMAIFRYTPSPFCILDEVDAPLDESNIQRMTRLIKEMSKETQFIVITHAKRTMEVAQALYGVTMQEPGLSSLVSVRFEPVTHEVEAPKQAEVATA